MFKLILAAALAFASSSAVLGQNYGYTPYRPYSYQPYVYRSYQPMYFSPIYKPYRSRTTTTVRPDYSGGVIISSRSTPSRRSRTTWVTPDYAGGWIISDR